ncbi:SPOR domain-containing protein [Pseudaminobacter sp. NGMCC 1.201702]|uniref:SPOR domain-containing protein n=1 Tax=Pseudaminobacter sp. NGMCC 1.201702 TaxID=3391825 RepID=UPI0039F02635
MAERTQLKAAHQDHFSEDDPFAELTRIMGFDPREPVQRQADSAPAEQAVGADEDDFSIDLERELLGDFAGSEVDSPRHDASVFDDAAAAGVFDEAVAASLENELSGVEAPATSWPADEPAQTEAVAFEGQPVAESDSDDFAFAAAQEPEAIFAQDAEVGLDDIVSDRPVEASESEAAAPFDTDFDLDGDWLAAEDTEPSAMDEVESVPAAEEVAAPVAEFDAANIEPTPDQDESTSYQDEAPRVEVEDSYAGDLESAPSEVDIDFTSIPLGSAHVEPAIETDLIETDLEDELQSRLAEVHELSPAHVAETREPSPAPIDENLEDELNALLGNAPIHAAPVPPVAETQAVEDFSHDDGELELTAENFHEEQPSEELSAVEVEPVAEIPSDHSYSRGNYRVESASYAAPDNHEEVASHAGDNYVASHHDEPDVHFDDDAFDAAFAGSIQEAAAQEPELAAYSDQPVPAEQPQELPDEQPQDPYAELAALTAEFKPARPAETWQAQAVQEAQPQDYGAQDYTAADYGSQGYQDENYQDESAFGAQENAQQPAAYEDFPDIETVDVPEQAVALADDLDIPEVAYEEEPAAPAYDDIDAEFASLLNEMNSPEPVAPAPAPVTTEQVDEDDRLAAQFEREFAAENGAYQAAGEAYQVPNVAAAAVAAAAAGTAGAGLAHTGFASQMRGGQGGGDVPSSASYAARSQAEHVDDFSYDPDDYDGLDVPAYDRAEARRQPSRRNLLIAGIIGAVVVVGGIGVFALGGGTDSGAPALVKADDDPIKVRPENPGGTTVPNQDNKVYETVSRNSSPSEPKQETLVTTAEEPVDLAAQEDAEAPAADLAAAPGFDDGVDAPAPSAKSEDRIEQVLRETGDSNSEIVAVAPRKVRTMVVRSDGTLVPREDPAPAATEQASQIDPATTASESVVDTAAAAVPPLAGEAASATPAAQPAGEPVPAEAGAAPGAPATANPQSTTTPSSVAVAPNRPSDQPVDIVGEVKADKIAALAPAAAGGAWSMQIASQPSEAAAQSSYQDLLRRYGSVLNGHPANIVKAEIAGKGTFWRVRVPAETRNDAIKLCESYKAAGGNCFVSK